MFEFESILLKYFFNTLVALNLPITDCLNYLLNVEIINTDKKIAGYTNPL